MSRDINADIKNQNSPKFKKVVNPLEELKINSTKGIGQRPRSAGFKSFLSWFKKVENLQRPEEVESEDSESDSSEEDSSSSSTATVASFSFLPPNKYKPYGEASQPEKFFSPGPYTETYHKLIQERNRRRNLDKNLSLRKKYSLYSSGTIGNKVDKNENVKVETVETPDLPYDTFSLPSFSKLKVENNENDSRKTASLSTRNVKTGSHVKGKRKAPLPPINTEYMKSYRKKRKAPPPPLIMPKAEEVENIVKKDEKTSTNSQITRSPLVKDKRQRDVEEKGKKSPQIQNLNSEISPKPWYKRESKTKLKSTTPDSSKKKKHEFPEVSFFRCSQIFENFRSVNSDKQDSENKNEKRISRLLPNISELDREAAEIIKHHKSTNENEPIEVLMWKANVVNNNPSSARELICKFNALSNEQTSLKCNSNLEIKLSNDNIKRNVTKSPEDSRMNASFVPNSPKMLHFPKNVPHEGEISKSFKAEIFSALPSLANIENTKQNPTENEAQIKSIQETHQKLNEIEEKVRLRELLKEMKNSLPKRPKVSQIKETGAKIECDDKLEKADKKQTTVNELPNRSDIVSKAESDTSCSGPSKITPLKCGDVKESDRNNSSIIPESDKLPNMKLSYMVMNTTPVIEPPRVTDVLIKNVTKAQNALMNNSANKVSSFAQTKSILCKSEQGASNDIYVKVSNQPSSNLPNGNILYMNVEESSNLDCDDKKIVQNSVLDNSGNNTNVLLKKLEQAITEGDDDAAAKLAKDLAMLKVNCLVMCSPKTDATQPQLKKVNVYIEDQFSHQGPLPLQIFETITMGELKDKISKEFNIPIVAQRWIIGKQLADDDKAFLTQYNKKDFETPLFLYVMSLDKKNNVNSDLKISPSNSKSEPSSSALLNDMSEKDKGNVLSQNGKHEIISKEIIEIKKVEEKQKVIPVNITKTNGEMKDVTKNTWICNMCTLINSLLSPLCSACGSKKPSDAEKYKPNINIVQTKREDIKREDPKNDDAGNHYMQLLNLDNHDLISNTEEFDCSICLTNYGPLAGVMLRECLHIFCKECLKNTIRYSEDVEPKCPYRDQNYFCDSVIQEREIKALVDKNLYERHLAKSVKFAENKIKNAFHCKTPDCKGWCIFDDNVNEFLCPVCKKNNCLTCQAIHEGKNCKEYQEKISNTDNPTSDGKEGQQTKEMLDDMVKRGEAMLCPSCKIILMKKWGCDWVRCSMCKTEICWVTRGPRWGPEGKGDTSAGCRCGENGMKCHPKCNYCH